MKFVKGCVCRVRDSSGFTFFEALIFISLLFIFILLPLLILMPGEEFSHLRDLERLNDLNRLINAISDYKSKNGEEALINVSSSPTEICKKRGGCGNLIDLNFLLSDTLKGIPSDPLCPYDCGPNGTGYFIFKDKGGRIIVRALLSEGGEILTVSKQ